MSDHDEVRAVIQEYVDACKAGNVDRLKAIFHPDALMSGFLMGNYMMGSPQPFYDAVTNPAAPADSSAAYEANIVSVEVSGKVASAVLKEKGFMGMNFTDYFHLASTDGKWKIIAKTFTQE